VVKVPFEPAWGSSQLPEGLIHTDTDVIDLPKSIRFIFTSLEGGEGQVSIETIQGLPADDAYPEDVEERLMIHGQSAVCVKGAWDEQQHWQAEADGATLTWTAGELSYRISHASLRLRCEDLLRIGESLR
jgi:hypothetical protein